MRTFFLRHKNIRLNRSTEFSYVRCKYLGSAEDQSTEKRIVPQIELDALRQKVLLYLIHSEEK